MTAPIRGEIIKATTTRTILVYAAMATVLAVAQVLVTILATSSDLTALADKKEAIAGLPLVLLLLGIVGAAGEHRHRTVAPAVLVSGRDGGVMLLARAAAYAITGVAVAALAMVSSLAVGLPLLASESGTALAFGDVVLVAGGSLLAAALSAMLGVALGALVRNQVAAVTGTLVVIFVALPLVHALSATALDLTPFGAAQGVAGATLAALSWSEAGLVLVGWTLVALIAAIAAERRRDIA
jgi:ABC-2 type transport system permease protein